MPNSSTLESIVMTALEATEVKGDVDIQQIGQVLQQYVQEFITKTLKVRDAQFQQVDIHNLFVGDKATINVQNIDARTLAEQIAKNLNAQAEQLQTLAKQPNPLEATILPVAAAKRSMIKSYITESSSIILLSSIILFFIFNRNKNEQKKDNIKKFLEKRHKCFTQSKSSGEHYPNKPLHRIPDIDLPEGKLLENIQVMDFEEDKGLDLPGKPTQLRNISESEFQDIINDLNSRNIKLTRLNLNYNYLSITKIKKLTEALSTSGSAFFDLAELQLVGCSLNDSFAKELGKAFEKNSNLLVLFLSDNNLSSNGIKALLGNSSNISKTSLTNLSKLNLAHNPIGDNASHLIENMLKTHINLQNLDLQNCLLGFNTIKSLAKGLEESASLKILNIRANNLSDDEITELAKSLNNTNCVLETLNLSVNRIHSVGAQAMSDALQINNNLKILNLEYNEIDELGTYALLKSLSKNPTIRSLYLSFNLIGSSKNIEGFDNLEANSITLEDFSLRCVSLTNTLALSVRDKLNSERLKKIDLGENRISDKVCNSFYRKFKSIDPILCDKNDTATSQHFNTMKYDCKKQSKDRPRRYFDNDCVELVKSVSDEECENSSLFEPSPSINSTSSSWYLCPSSRETSNTSALSLFSLVSIFAPLILIVFLVTVIYRLRSNRRDTHIAHDEQFEEMSFLHYTDENNRRREDTEPVTSNPRSTNSASSEDPEKQPTPDPDYATAYSTATTTQPSSASSTKLPARHEGSQNNPDDKTDNERSHSYCE